MKAIDELSSKKMAVRAEIEGRQINKHETFFGTGLFLERGRCGKGKLKKTSHAESREQRAERDGNIVTW